MCAHPSNLRQYSRTATLTIRFPAEWETQSALQLSWPHSQTDCARNLCAVEDTLFALAAEAGRRQGLLINCADARQLPRIRHCLTAAQVPAAHLHLTSHPTNDIWVRDHGPISVRPSGGWQLLDFEFNGWGAKYPAALDNQLTARLHADGLFAATPLAQPKLELEGGNLETDGAGTLLAVAQGGVENDDVFAHGFIPKGSLSGRMIGRFSLRSSPERAPASPGRRRSGAGKEKENAERPQPGHKGRRACADMMLGLRHGAFLYTRAAPLTSAKARLEVSFAASARPESGERARGTSTGLARPRC